MKIDYSIILPFIRDTSRPYLEANIEAHHDDKRIGYLRFAWISRELTDRYLPTVWHHVAEFSGWGLPIESNSDMTNVGVIYELWLGAFKYTYWTYRPPSQVSNNLKLSECEPTLEEMLSDLDILAERKGFYKKFKKFKKSINHVYVDYSRVQDASYSIFNSDPPTKNYQRLGIGSTMYTLASMWLAVNMGVPLHSSSLRSPSAIGIWEKMLALGYPIYSVRRPSTNNYVLALDYTQTPFLLAKAHKVISRLPTFRHPEYLLYLD